MRRLSRSAPSVSAVSPLWLMANTSVSRVIGVLRWRNSLANSTSVGILRELLDQIFAHHRGVQCRAAAGQNDPSTSRKLLGRHVQAAEFRRAFFAAEPAAHGIPHRVGLLKDFLEHVVRVIAFLDVAVGELNFADLVIAGFARDRADLEFVALDCDDIEVVQINRVARVARRLR